MFIYFLSVWFFKLCYVSVGEIVFINVFVCVLYVKSKE